MPLAYNTHGLKFHFRIVSLITTTSSAMSRFVCSSAVRVGLGLLLLLERLLVTNIAVKMKAIAKYI